MNKITVACFFGGCSSEYDVSLVSASSILKQIDKNKYEILKIGITKEGNFYLYNGTDEDIEKNQWYQEKNCQKVTISTNRLDHGLILVEENRVLPIDIAFPILHGKNGEDGRLQGLFELAGIKYVGCDMISSAICMDKFLAHQLVKSKGILTPTSYLFTNTACTKEIEEKIATLSYPLFVKPLRAGSSFGITKVKEQLDLQKAINKALKYDNKFVIEEAIDGFEVGCAILGNQDVIAGEIDEIELQGGFFDYVEKYHLNTSKIHLPARLNETIRKNIQNTAIQIYQILGCQGFARVDMFYTKDGQIVFNEVNTIPGFTTHSRYPSMLQAVGYSFTEIIDQLITLGLER